MTREPMVLPVKRLDPRAALPSRAHPTDAGLDLRANEEVTLRPFERRLVGTGIAVAIPEGHCGLVMPRSGLALKEGLSIANTPGLIDAPYRGELKVCCINLDPEHPIHIERGERIAQLVIEPVPPIEPVEVDELDETDRGAGGFGSSGVL